MTALYNAILVPFTRLIAALSSAVLSSAGRNEHQAIGAAPDSYMSWYDINMHDDTVLEVLARRAFPGATRIIILAAGDPGGTLFHDADTVWQAAGIAATSWDEATSTLYLRRLPPPRRLHCEPGPPDRPA